MTGCNRTWLKNLNVTRSKAKVETGSREEFLICAISRLLCTPEIGHVAVGAASPIPGAAALLAQATDNPQLRVSIIHGDTNNPFTDGGRELFDCAGQGRIDAFFLGGVQIDGAANINLVGLGKYPETTRRFPGSFGSAYMYFTVPNVFLFAHEHSARVLVPRVDFISAPGSSPDDVARKGGPKYLVSNLAIMEFDRAKKLFRLLSVAPGHSVAEVIEKTGFEIEIASDVSTTGAPEAEQLELLKRKVAPSLARTYPDFTARVFGSNA